jgi:hypothetical protein
MPQPTNYSANLVFGGRVDSSLDKSVKQIENQLRLVNKETVAFQESISSIGTGILAVGTAFLGLRTGLDMFEDLADKGAQLSDLTNQIRNNLAGFSSLKAPISDVASQFDTFNTKLKQTIGYSTQITESFEKAFTGKGYDPGITMRMTSLMEQVEAGRREKLTPEQAEGAVGAIDEAIKSGSQESVIQLNRLLGLKLNPQSLLGVPNTPGNPNVAYGEREAILERALGNSAKPNAGLEMRRDPRMAGYLLGQEQSEIAGKLGTGTNDLFAPVQQGMTKALQNLEQSGELEKFDAWSKDAGQRLSSFFQKFIEPKLPGALQKLEDLIDAIGDRIDKLSRGKDWWQDPKTEQHIHWDRIPKLLGDGWNAISGAVNKDFQNSLDQNKKLHPPSSAGVVSPTSIYDSVPAFAAGGIVTRPTIGLIGEKEPEGVFPLSFLGSDTKDLTKANTEATKKETDALTALTQKLEDNLSLLRQQGQFQTLGQMQGQGGGMGVGAARGGVIGRRGTVSGGSTVPGDTYGATPTNNTLFEPDTSGSNRLNARFNNPGALGPTKSALKYGGTPSGKSDTGHSFMKFPTKEAGAAALSSAIRNWVGPGETGEAEYIAKKLGLPLSTRITDEFLKGPMGIKLMQAQASYEGANVLTKDQWGRAQDWAYKGINPRIKAKSSSETAAPDSTTTPATTTPTVHYSPHVAVTVHGHGDANTIEMAVKRVLAQHGEELGHHIRRTLQDNYRRDQRVNYA